MIERDSSKMKEKIENAAGFAGTKPTVIVPKHLSVSDKITADAVGTVVTVSVRYVAIEIIRVRSLHHVYRIEDEPYSLLGNKLYDAKGNKIN